MSAGQILYKGRYSKQIAQILATTDFAKIKKLMEINGEVWELDIDEVGVPSIKEITMKAVELLFKAETDPTVNAVYQHKSLVVIKSPTNLGLFYMPILVSTEL